MKTHSNLYSKIADIDNIKLAHHNARKNKSFYKSVKEVDANLEEVAKSIQAMLINKTYDVAPEDYTIEIINDKGKERELAKLEYGHRIIQRAMMQILEPIFMETLCNFACASVKGRGTHYAYKLTSKYMKDRDGSEYCLKIDIKKFYPNIDHQILKDLLRKKIKCKDTLRLLDKIIDSTEGTKGIPIGSYLSQYLANFYLAYFDHYLKEELRCRYVVRYMDDIIIFSNSKVQLHKTLSEIKEYLNKELKLEVKSNYQIFPTNKRGVDFVGYRFFYDYTLLRKSTCKRMKKRLKEIKDNKTDKGKLLNYNEWCSINSYVGRLIYCDHYRLYEKYIQPLCRSLNRYYYFAIVNKNKKRLMRYYNKLRKKRYIKVYMNYNFT